MIFSGIPNLHTTWSKIKRAVSTADTSTVVGMHATYLENLSTTVRMQSWPRSVTGRKVMKSSVMCWNGLVGTECGYSKPAGAWVEERDY